MEFLPPPALLEERAAIERADGRPDEAARWAAWAAELTGALP